MSLKRNALIVIGLWAVARCLTPPAPTISVGKLRDMARRCHMPGCEVQGELVQPVVTDDEERPHCPVCGGYWVDE